jgi:hypothetical protein
MDVDVSVTSIFSIENLTLHSSDEEPGSSETSVYIYQITWINIP